MRLARAVALAIALLTDGDARPLATESGSSDNALMGLARSMRCISLLAAFAIPGCDVSTGPYGSINIERTESATGVDFAIYARFELENAGAASCTSHVVGTCTIRRCTQPTIQLADGGFEGASAGTVSIASGSYSLPITWIGYEYLEEPFDQATRDALQPGATITIQGSGAQVPAFSTMGTMPDGPITLTSPSSPALRRGSDLVLSWTGSPVPNVRAEITSPASNNAVTTIECDYPGSANGATIPAAVLNDMPDDGTGRRRGLFLVDSVQSTITHVGHYTVSVNVAHRLFSNIGVITVE